MTSAPRSIFRMNLNIFALFFSITVIPFHALSLSCAEPSTLDHPASAPQSDKQSAKFFIPYYPHVNKQISSILHRHSVSSACTSNKNLRDLLSSTKSRQPALQTSNVIYQIPCKDCSATYCGQTSRPLHKRISEHERYTRPAYSHATDLQQSSALAQHAHASNRLFISRHTCEASAPIAA